jgi:hypothetical protein
MRLKGHYVSTAGLNEEAVKKCIREQEREDKRPDELELFEGRRRREIAAFRRLTKTSRRHCRWHWNSLGLNWFAPAE